MYKVEMGVFSDDCERYFRAGTFFYKSKKKAFKVALACRGSRILATVFNSAGVAIFTSSVFTSSALVKDDDIKNWLGLKSYYIIIEDVLTHGHKREDFDDKYLAFKAARQFKGYLVALFDNFNKPLYHHTLDIEKVYDEEIATWINEGEEDDRN